jgi:hypothetical protein
LYLPFSREFGIKGRWNYDYWVGGTYDQLSNYILLETFFSGSNSKYSVLYKGNKKFTNKTYWFIVECINNYLSPRSKEDHLINILNRIGIDFDYYIDWLLDMVIVYPDGTVDILLYNDDLPVYERIEISSLPYFLPGDLTYIGPL